MRDAQTCPQCDGDGYMAIVDEWGGAVGSAPCPRGCDPPDSLRDIVRSIKGPIPSNDDMEEIVERTLRSFND